jgi:hypothetical protein
MHLIDLACRAVRRSATVRFRTMTIVTSAGETAPPMVCIESWDDSRRRSAKVDVGQLVFGGYHPFGQFGLFVLGLSKVLHNLGSKILVQLNEL